MSPIWSFSYWRELNSAVGNEPLGNHPVLRTVDVEPFVRLGDERDHHGAGSRAALEHHSRPGDLQRRVLDVDLWKRLIGRAVPRLRAVAGRQEREHPVAADHPHLAGMLRALLDGTERIDFVLCQKALPRPADRVGGSEGTRGAK